MGLEGRMLKGFSRYSFQCRQLFDLRAADSGGFLRSRGINDVIRGPTALRRKYILWCMRYLHFV